MPYGKDFLDALDGILVDGGAISTKIKMQCSNCQRMWDPAENNWRKGYPSFMHDVCDKCADAKIVDSFDYSIGL